MTSIVLSPLPAAAAFDYQFHHPYERKRIEMIMYYADMAEVRLNESKRQLSFRINKRLGAWPASRCVCRRDPGRP